MRAELNDLAALATVAEERSFTRAAGSSCSELANFAQFRNLAQI